MPARKYATKEERRAARRLQRRQSYQRNAARELENNRQWRERNSAKLVASGHARYLQNRKAILAKRAEERRENPAKFKARELAYDATHRKERAENAKARREANPAYLQAYAQRADVKERARHNAKRYYYTDLVSSRAKGCIASALFKLRYPEKIRVQNQRRRARRRLLRVDFTVEHRRFMLNYWSYACAACGNQEGFEWTLADDHWIPIVSPHCPGTVYWNIVPLCHGEGGCNNMKGSKQAERWLKHRFGHRKAKQIAKAVATYFCEVQKRFEHPNAPPPPAA
jgi:hypothetical protein